MKSALWRTVFDDEFLENIKKEINALKEFETIAKEDENIKKEIEGKLYTIKEEIKTKKTEKRFCGKHDKNNTFLSIYAGTGGRDAEDWVKILYRMYQKYFSKKNFQFKEIDKTTGEGGIKSITLKVCGKYAFGWLKEENGVHRLVRISPFSAKKLRHTSFALVEVLPEIKEENTKIKEENLKIETFRASGAGGQYVNRRESAIRIIHIPTGISVSCQAERLQGENKKTALSVLQSKLFNLEKEENEKVTKEARGEIKEARWGNQIRSYFFQPYQMVRNHKTGFKTSKLNEILDGNLDEFLK